MRGERAAVVLTSRASLRSTRATLATCHNGNVGRRTPTMPMLLRSSETMGCGATIKLDSGEVVWVSIARAGVLVRHWDMSGGVFKTFLNSFLGATLYNEKNVYKGAQTAIALRLEFPEQAAELPRFKNPVLCSFANAIWHCKSAAEVSIVLNEGAAKLPPEEMADAAALISAFEAAKNYEPPKRPPEMTPGTYNVLWSDGVKQEIRFVPAEIQQWVAVSDKSEADKGKDHQILRVVDLQGHIVWEL